MKRVPVLIIALFFTLAPALSFADVNVTTSISVYPGYGGDNVGRYEFSNASTSQQFFGADFIGTYSNGPGTYPYYYALYSDVSFCTNSNCTMTDDPIFRIPAAGFNANACSSPGGTTAVAYSETSTAGFYLPATFYVVAGASTYCNGSNFSITAINFWTSTSSTSSATTTASSTPPATYSGSCPSVSWLTDPVGAIQSALCSVMLPNSSQEADMAAQLGAIKDSVSSKPPMGYLTAISTDLATFETTSTTSTILNASNTISLDASPFGLLDGAVAIMVWVTLAFYVLHRGAAIQL